MEFATEELDGENGEDEESDQHQKSDVGDRLEVLCHGVSRGFQIRVSVEDSERTESAERFENSQNTEVQGDTSVGNQRDDNDDEIEPVPQVS